MPFSKGEEQAVLPQLHAVCLVYKTEPDRVRCFLAAVKEEVEQSKQYERIFTTALKETHLKYNERSYWAVKKKNRERERKQQPTLLLYCLVNSVSPNLAEGSFSHTSPLAQLQLSQPPKIWSTALILCSSAPVLQHTEKRRKRNHLADFLGEWRTLLPRQG